jgi:hypothetical protein
VPDLRTSPSLAQGKAPQAIDRGRQFPKRHTVPSTITPQMQALIVSEWRGGRSAVQIAKEYSTIADVVLDLVARHQAREIAALRGRAA